MRKIVRMQLPHPASSRQGFSLVELAIVLAILGLLAGGVVAGRSLIRSAGVQAVTKEYAAYQGAVDSFRARFKALPGDMTNAIDYWGADASCPLTPTNTVRKKATCNGNGDQHIATMIPPYDDDFYELYRAWQHLANAGMIADSYTGVAGSGSFQHSIPGQNVPGSRLKGGAWNFYPMEGAAALHTTSYFPIPGYKEVFMYGTTWGAATATAPILSGPEAYGIDKKIDDGRPGYGKVSTFMDAGPGFDCITNDTQSTAEYITTDNDVRCGLIFQVVSAVGN